MAVSGFTALCLLPEALTVDAMSRRGQHECARSRPGSLPCPVLSSSSLCRRVLQSYQFSHGCELHTLVDKALHILCFLWIRFQTAQESRL